jgi:hypothetical protein
MAAQAMPTSAIPASGLPASGLPASGLPASGLPASSMPAVHPAPPGPVAPSKAFQLGRLQFGWGALISALVVVVLVIGGATTAVIVATKPPAGSTADGPAGSSVRWQGSLAFGSFDLDPVPPASTPGFDLTGAFGPQLHVSNGAYGGRWPGGAVTREKCADAARSGEGGPHSMDVPVGDHADVGMEFCIVTQANHTAYLKVTATSDSTVTADVTVWEQ